MTTRGQVSGLGLGERARTSTEVIVATGWALSSGILRPAALHDDVAMAGFTNLASRRGSLGT